jgi:hypothetical protein
LIVTTGCAEPERSIDTITHLGMKDWSELEGTLERGFPKSLASDETIYDRVLDSEIASQIYRDGTFNLWNGMCRSGEPFVSLLGYRCIVEKMRAKSLRSAMDVVARCGQMSSVMFYEPIKQINETSPATENMLQFTEFVRDPSHEHLNLTYLGSLFHEDFIQQWALNTDLAEVPASIQCLAVSQVYTESANKGTAVPPSIETIFNTFDQHSDERLVWFLWHAPTDTEESRIISAIEKLLREDSVPFALYQIGLGRHVALLKAQIEINSLHLTPNQLKRYEQFLQIKSVKKRIGA